MKVLIALFVLITNYSFSQDKIFEAKVENPKQFQQDKSSGEFKFIFPKATKKADIEKNAAYYTSYFTVSYNENNNIVTVKMVQNDQKNRQIIQRFLAANKITQIEMDGTLYKINEFYEKQLK